MLRVDLKDLLIDSLRSGEVLYKRKRFTLGKERYTVIYELEGHDMFIKQIKHVTKSQKLEKRLRKRREFLIRSQRTVKFRAKNIVAVQREDVNEMLTEILQLASAVVATHKCNTATQTEFFAVDSSADTYDLVRKVSQSQQTREVTFENQGAQTLPSEVYSVSVQAVCESFVAAVQTDYATSDEAQVQTDWTYGRLDSVYDYYAERIIECQENHTSILHHTNNVIGDLCKIMQCNSDMTVDVILRQLEQTKVALMLYTKEQIQSMQRRDKKYLRRFLRQAAAASVSNALNQDIIITELNSQNTQTDFQVECASQETQTKKKKGKSCFCICC